MSVRYCDHTQVERTSPHKDKIENPILFLAVIASVLWVRRVSERLCPAVQTLAESSSELKYEYLMPRLCWYGPGQIGGVKWEFRQGVSWEKASFPVVFQMSHLIVTSHTILRVRAPLQICAHTQLKYCCPPSIWYHSSDSPCHVDGTAVTMAKQNRGSESQAALCHLLSIGLRQTASPVLILPSLSPCSSWVAWRIRWFPRMSIHFEEV